MSTNPPPSPRLLGIHVLVAEPDPQLALALSAPVANQGARVSVVRSLRAAARTTGAHDAAIVPHRRGVQWGRNVATLLRSRPRPCLSFVMTDDAAAVRQLSVEGHPAVVVWPTSGPQVVAAVQRTVAATRGYRADNAAAPSLSAVLERAVAVVARRARLSHPESSVLRLIAMGYRYPEIGDALAISPRSVKTHAARLRSKTGATTRSDLVRSLFGN